MALRYQRLIERKATGVDDQVLVNNWLNMATWLKNRGRLEEADAVLDQAIALASHLGDFRAQESLHLAKGIVWRRKAEATPHDVHVARVAEGQLRRAADLAEFLGDVAGATRVAFTCVPHEMAVLGHDRWYRSWSVA
jgi:hypothetical protein